MQTRTSLGTLRSQSRNLGLWRDTLRGKMYPGNDKKKPPFNRVFAMQQSINLFLIIRPSMYLHKMNRINNYRGDSLDICLRT